MELGERPAEPGFLRYDATPGTFGSDEGQISWSVAESFTRPVDRCIIRKAYTDDVLAEVERGEALRTEGPGEGRWHARIHVPEEEPRAGYPTKHVEVQVVAVNDAGESNHGRSFDPELYGAGRQARLWRDRSRLYRSRCLQASKY